MRRTLSTDAHTRVNVQLRERSGGKERKKKLPVPGSGIESTTLTLERKAPVCIATFTLHKHPWLQLLYEYHERYILNSIAKYPMHMKERERESVIELNLKIQKTIQYNRV